MSNPHPTPLPATTLNNTSTIHQQPPPQSTYPHHQQQYPIQKGKPRQSSETDPKQHLNTEQSIKYWFISLGLFIAAFVVYVGVWAVERFALNHEVASHYYEKGYSWSDAVPTIYQVKQPFNAKSIALDLVLQWVMWKAPLMLFTYNCLRLNEGKVKWILLGVTAAICLAADIVLTIFLSSIYNNMMYFGLFSLFTVIASAVGNMQRNRTKEGLLDSLLPLLCIAVIFTIQVLALPILYYIYSKNLSSEAAIFLTFYGYPFVDLIMYGIVLFMGSYTSREVRTFYSQIHYLLIGYEVGFILLIGYTEVEFYYLISYLVFRNIFSNWVMWKWENVVKLPPVVAGWGLAYYFSYALMFLPFAGVGNLVIGSGYYSMILANTRTLLYYIPSSLYPSDTFTPSTTPTDYALNLQFKGHVFKIAAVIIWVATTFSQRYSRKMPEIVNTVVYNLFGIYLFYLGLAAGVSTQSLTKYSVVA